MSINMPQQNRASNYDKKAIEASELCLNVRFYDIKRSIGTASSLEEVQFKNLYFTDSINAKIQNTHK